MLKRNDTDKNGVHLPIDEELLKNVKIIAKLASTPQEMVSWFLCIKEDQTESLSAFLIPSRTRFGSQNTWGGRAGAN